MNICSLEVNDPAWKETLRGLPHETYQRPEYVALEARRTCSLPRAMRLTDDSGQKVFLLPYLLRDCAEVDPSITPGTVWDVVSPYGYPGYLFNNAARQDPHFRRQALKELLGHWRTEGVCSAFLRLNPILNDDTSELNELDCQLTTSQTISIELTGAEEEIWNNVHRKLRTTIRRSRRIDCVVREVDYEPNITVFQEIYEDTMARASAKSTYYFGREYFQELASLGDDVHILVVEFGGEIVAATIVLECGEIVQAHLAGTRSEHINLSPLCILLYEAGLWAKSRGNRLLHLGGGLGGAEDKLLSFKSKFSPMRHNFTSVRIVVDQPRYQDLVKRRAQAVSTTRDTPRDPNYFPAYRS